MEQQHLKHDASHAPGHCAEGRHHAGGVSWRVGDASRHQDQNHPGHHEEQEAGGHRGRRLRRQGRGQVRGRARGYVGDGASAAGAGALLLLQRVQALRAAGGKRRQGQCGRRAFCRQAATRSPSAEVDRQTSRMSRKERPKALRVNCGRAGDGGGWREDGAAGGRGTARRLGCRRAGAPLAHGAAQAVAHLIQNCSSSQAALSRASPA